MRYSLTFFLLLVWPIILFAATRNVANTGNWSDTGTWTGGTIPASTDDVTMSNNKILTVQSTDDVEVVTITPGNSNTITIDAGGQLTVNNLGNDAFIVNNGFTLNVNGTLIINGNLVVNNNLILTVTGDLVINGNVVLNNGASLDVTSTGSLTLDGNFTGGNNTSVNVDGTVDVTGDVDVGTGSQLTGGGTFSAGGSCDDSGSASFCESSTLPVSLLFFKGNAVANYVQLEWATYEEENFEYFCIERSSNGLEYSCIGQVSGTGDGTGIENYSYKDESPYPGRSYYRLKSVDIDGSFEYSGIVRIDFSDPNVFSIYPNPSKGEFTVRLDFDPASPLQLKVMDSRGAIILEDVMDSYQSYYSLEPGMYFLQISDGSSIRIGKPLIIR